MTTALLILLALVAFIIMLVVVIAVERSGVFYLAYYTIVFFAVKALIRTTYRRPRLNEYIVGITAAARGAVAAWIVYLASFIIIDIELAQSDQHFLMIGAGLFAMFPLSVLLRGCEVSQNTSITEDISSLDSVVLFLRSFTTDGIFYDEDEAGFFFGARALSEEEKIAELFQNSKLGRFVALALPGEKIQELGADRIEISSQDWKEAILMLLERANAIVMRLGDSESLLWELDAIIQSDKLYRTLFLIPMAASEDDLEQNYNRLLQKISNCSDYPEFPPKLSNRARFLYFDREGNAQVLITPENEKPDISKLLEPFFTQLGISIPAKRFKPDTLIAKLVSGCVIAYYLILKFLV